MTNKGILPSDIIPDGADFTQINGVQVRKGTVAAFLANINLVENPHASAEDKKQALHTIQELAPAVIATGLQNHVTFKNSQVEEILQQAKKLLQKGNN